MIHTAVFPVAGKGSRLLPATQSVPKELLPVYDTPVIQFSIDEARHAGITRFIFVTHQDKPAIEDYVNYACQGLDVHFVMQPEPLGLGHAILMAQDLASDGPFAVLLPDDLIIGPVPALTQMTRAYDPGLARHMLAAMTVPREKSASYGILDTDVPAPGRYVPVRGMVEKPAPGDAPSNLAVVGRYILDPTVFETLRNTPKGVGGEIQLTDAIRHDLGRLGVAAFRFEGERFDCGQADGLLAAGNAMQDAVERKDRNLAANLGANKDAGAAA